MFAYYLRVEKVFLENKKAHTGQIKGITAGLKPTEKQKKFDTFTVSNLIYYNGASCRGRTSLSALPWPRTTDVLKKQAYILYHKVHRN